jgi:excisionase family DNA binding protein
VATSPYDCHVNNYDDITLLRPDEVAKALGITVDTVYKWCSRGLLPHYRLEKCIRFKLEDVQEFLAQRRIEPN